MAVTLHVSVVVRLSMPRGGPLSLALLLTSVPQLKLRYAQQAWLLPSHCLGWQDAATAGYQMTTQG